MTSQPVLIVSADAMLSRQIASHLIDEPCTPVPMMVRDFSRALAKVLLAGHAAAADCPDWPAERIIGFLEPAGDRARNA